MITYLVIAAIFIIDLLVFAYLWRRVKAEDDRREGAEREH